MSSNIETKSSFIWVKEAISKKHIKSYDYKYFSNIQEIGTGGFGKVSRAMYKNSEQYLALKSFINLDNTTLEELSREVNIKIR